MEKDDKLALAVGLAVIAAGLHGKGTSFAYTAPQPSGSGSNSTPRVVSSPSSLAVGASFDLGITPTDGITSLIISYKPESTGNQYGYASLLASGNLFAVSDGVVSLPGVTSYTFLSGLTLEKVAGVWRFSNTGGVPIEPVNNTAGPYIGTAWAIIYPTGHYTIS